jgi:hypothetical protein
MFSLFEFTPEENAVGLHSNIAHQIRTQKFSMFTKYDDSIKITNSNFSDCSSVQHLAGFEIGRNQAVITFSVLQNFRAGGGKGAMVLWQCPGFVVQATFRNISVGGDSATTAVIAWLDGSFQHGTFSETTVKACSVRTGKLFYCQDSNRIVFKKCCFEAKRENCFNPVNAIVDMGNTFGEPKCPAVAPVGRIGFRQLAGRLAKIRWNVGALFIGCGILGTVIVGIQFLANLGLTSL